MPQDFETNHYVPILKTKQGERWSLANLSPDERAHITPLLELHAHKDLLPAAQAQVVCESLNGAWGSDDEFFFDTKWLHESAGDPAIIEAVFSSARECDLLAIPVITPSYGPTTIEQLTTIIETDTRGCLLRVKPSELEDESLLQVVADLGLEPEDVHLMLDYKAAQMNLGFDIPRIPELERWRTFTAASGVFPRSLLGRPIDEWFYIDRLDWTSWRSAVLGKKEIKRMPSFADYTTRDPGAPASGGKASVNLRYTRTDDWLVRLGGRLEDGAAPQMRTFCELLVAHESFSGADFSAGDAEIYNKTLPDTGTGGPGDWAKWCISHHLAFVIQQIANLVVP